MPTIHAVDQKTPHEPRSLLARLGLHGLSSMEPVILAALATEEPLLLIGPHGTAKSLLLTRIAEALELDWRHYNASLLNFDDLVGFPLPGPDRTLEYVRTPAAIWGAGAVIFDEISRCRPDIQNKLFPIIHERKAQGLPIEGLRHRWAAMNPPMMEEDEDGYLGSEPLDPALADRFAFIVPMPGWEQLSERDQLAIIRADHTDVEPTSGAALRSAIDATKAKIDPLRDAIGERVADHVRVLLALLAQARLCLSPRRAGMLSRAVIAVHAASLSLDPGAAIAESALLALLSNLPQRAQGLKIQETKVLLAHKEAWRLAGVKPGDPLRAVLLAADPLERVRLAVAARKIRKGDFSGIVADALAQLPPGAREAAAVHLFETGAVGRLNAAVAEQAAEIYQHVATPQAFSETQHATGSRFQTWKRIKDLLSRLDADDPRAHLCANAIAAAYARKQLTCPEDAEQAFRAWHSADDLLAGSVA